MKNKRIILYTTEAEIQNIIDDAKKKKEYMGTSNTIKVFFTNNDDKKKKLYYPIKVVLNCSDRRGF